VGMLGNPVWLRPHSFPNITSKVDVEKDEFMNKLLGTLLNEATGVGNLIVANQ